MGLLGGPASHVRSAVAPLIDALYAARQPIGGLQNQVIHGDLNPENVLIAPGQPPALLDVAPFWRPPEFALAMFATWIGPRRGDPSVLRHFASVRHFDQLLTRAGIRMLLIMTNLDGFEAVSEARAARMILDYVPVRWSGPPVAVAHQRRASVRTDLVPHRHYAGVA